MGAALARPPGLPAAAARLHQPCLTGGELARQGTDEADAGGGSRMVVVQERDGGDAPGTASRLARIVGVVQARLRGLDGRAAPRAQPAGELPLPAASRTAIAAVHSKFCDRGRGSPELSA